MYVPLCVIEFSILGWQGPFFWQGPFVWHESWSYITAELVLITIEVL